jgi:hypothetical protein
MYDSKNSLTPCSRSFLGCGHCLTNSHVTWLCVEIPICSQKGEEPTASCNCLSVFNLQQSFTLQWHCCWMEYTTRWLYTNAY